MRPLEAQTPRLSAAHDIRPLNAHARRYARRLEMHVELERCQRVWRLPSRPPPLFITRGSLVAAAGYRRLSPGMMSYVAHCRQAAVLKTSG